ncbi:hypothetical protein KA405_03400 [Patescibacteria group bacterium]|nr:hypothetical protein [Patescibacteria group bacterium]
MIRIVRLCLLLLAFFPLLTLAAPTKFEITVTPNPLKVSEFADVTVKAINSDGTVDTKADGDIWLEIENHEYTDSNIVLPGNGIGFFEPSDQ